METTQEMTILAVDDSETMQQMVRKTLEMGGYKVVVASDGRDGLEKFRTAGQFQAVVTDINMPNMDGITLIKEIRKMNPDIPIVALTTEGEDNMKTRGREAGANGWIVKPFRPPQFLDIVRQMLS